jgi:small subunit ribosomal protein S17
MNNTKIEQKSKPKEFVGKIVSNKVKNTVIVAVTHSFPHPKYLKMVKRTQKFAVHHTLLDLQVGEMLKIREVKPISKTKHFLAVERIKV